MIAHILLLPHPETNDGEAWAFGWATQRDVVWDDGEWTTEAPHFDGIHLVLARDGAEVYEGTDRAGRVLGVLVIGLEARVLAASLAFKIAALLGHEPGMDPAVALDRLRQIVALLGTLVLIDADGREVSDG